MYRPLFRTDFIAIISRMPNLPVKSAIPILAYIYGRLDKEKDIPEYLPTAGLSVSYNLGPRWDDVITWSDFKSETIFGFLSPNYTGQCT